MKIILASKSPRRQELLQKLNIKFDVMESCIDEKIDMHKSISSLVMSLAFQKAYDVSLQCKKDDIIIAADTLVYKDKILGKPSSVEDAYNMLRYLSGDVHDVYTGFCIIQVGSNKKIIDVCQTQVVFRELSDHMIREYISTGEPMDKAGAYGIQGYAMSFVKEIHGDFYNVVGLPVSRLISTLEDFKKK